MKKNSLLSKLTLILPTYGRQKHVIRNIDYWSNTGVTLLILDSSPLPIKSGILKSFGENIVYVHDTSHYNKRVVNSFSKINSKYTQLICDDEFYPIPSVESCIKELEKNDEIISCMGTCLGFDVDKENNKIFSKRVYMRLSENYDYTMNSDPVERLQNYIINYEPFLMYSITRTEIWKKAFLLPLKFEKYEKNNKKIEKFSFFASDEVQINMYLAFAGKSKIVPELYWLRSFGEHPPIREVYKHHEPEPELTFKEWWNSSNETNEYLKVLEGAYRATKIKINVSYKELALNCCELFIRGGGGEYLKHKIFYLKSKKKFISLCFLYLKLLIPSSLKNYIRSLRVWKNSQLLFQDELTNLKKKGIKCDDSELNKIHKIIEKFHFK